MEGYIGRIWKNYRVDKVVGIRRGLFLVCFKGMNSCAKVLKEERPFFDSKLVLIKPWSPDHEVSMEELMTVPIRIHIHAHYKYWGLKSLEKLTKTIGKFVKVNHTTASRSILSYARCMVEVKMNQTFPNKILFLDKRNQKEKLDITYEWRPTLCTNCKKYGHVNEQCYKRR
ncbi:Ribosomal RNA small subunit methyltransferase G [Bienertia sinuspersici]